MFRRTSNLEQPSMIHEFRHAFRVGFVQRGNSDPEDDRQEQKEKWHIISVVSAAQSHSSEEIRAQRQREKEGWDTRGRKQAKMINCE